MLDNDLISQMVEETLDNTTIELGFCSAKMCYRLEVQSQVLEIPMNWKPMGEITSGDVYLNTEVDQYQLLPILGQLLGRELSSITLTLAREPSSSIDRAA